MRVSAIILAAGLSRRMGEDKLLLPFGDGTLLSRALALVAGIPFHQRILVTTAGRLAAAPPPAGIEPVINHNPEAGQSSSLRLGVTAADGDAYLFFTADQPLLDRETVLWLLSHVGTGRIVYPTVEGKPRSPVLFPALYRDELLALRGDTGGRAVRAAHPDACLGLEAISPRPFLDIDTKESYRFLLDELKKK